jgi:hypothetical protein
VRGVSGGKSWNIRKGSVMGKMEVNIKDRYESLKQKVSGRKEPFDSFIHFLEKETTWLSSPASTRFHLCEEGGLLGSD